MTSDCNIYVGDQVTWSWGNGKGRGEVTERFESDVTRTIDGTEVTREANREKPAFMIEQEDGQRVLKSCSELEKAG